MDISRIYKVWIEDAYSKVVKKLIENEYTTLTKFFKYQSAFPKFQKERQIGCEDVFHKE